jgi:Proteasome subunit
MTLVVAIADKRLRMFMLTGDIMLSSDLPAGSLPRSNTINPPDKSRESYTHRGYAQKLVRLSDNVYLAWAGTLPDGQKLVRRARSEIQEKGKKARTARALEQTL